MNISALLVFVFAVVSAYGYAHIRCSDCNDPCSDVDRNHFINEYNERMNLPKCSKNVYISKKANPTWTCKPFKKEDMINYEKYYYAECGKCQDSTHEAKQILQDFKMLFKKNCPTHSHIVLEERNVSVSLGCTCVKK